MAGDGLSPSDIESFFSGGASGGGGGAPPPPPAGPVIEERFQKYDKMRKMLPEGAVRQKMANDGLSPSEIDGFFALVSGGGGGGGLPAPSPVRASKPVEKPAAPVGPVHPKVKNRVKMRDLFWNPIPDINMKETCWSEIDDTKVKLDLDTLDSLFGEKEKDDKKDEKKEGDKKKAASSKPKEIQLITDGNRTRNVNISISRLRMSYEDLKLGILRVSALFKVLNWS